ncbi:Pre-rRNA-processing protein TSR2-domain-containing protein [Xylariaceae sp. FL1272]|nr:Pre-rRNA-processing protein TSR2-domain-containing protein [Xylariaceae sp. FL1272]
MQMASTSSDGPSPETKQSEFEQGIVMSLHLWTSLSIAVQNQWGGPDSSDKRDWLAGAISLMFPSFPDLHKLTTTASQPTTSTSKSKAQKLPEEPIPEDIEETLLQVLSDEFETNVDDGSELEVADRIIKCRAQCAEGNFTLVRDLRKRWEESRGKKVVLRETEAPDQETDDSGSDDDEDDEGQNGDVEMSDAPQLVDAGVRRQKPEKIVDEDGFETVVRKR